MKDENKTKRQLLSELARMRRRVAKLAARDAERKQAEDALRESEQRYRQLVDLSPIAIVVHSQGKVVFANPAALRLIGAATAEDILGTAVLDLVHPDYRDLVVQRMRSAVEDSQPAPPVEEKFVRLDGAVIDIEAVSMPLTYQGQSAAQVVIRDITEHKRTEETLRESEHKFRSIVEQSSEGIMLLDEQGIVIDCNRAVEQITGLERDKVLGQTAWDFQFRLVLEERRSRAVYEQLESMWLTALRTGQAPFLNKTIEGAFRRADGSHRVVLQTLFPIKTDKGFRIGGISRDITERKQTEEALRKWAHIFEHAEWGVVVGSADGKTLEMMNPAFARMHGYTVGELTGQPIVDVFAPESRADLPEQIRIAHEKGHHTFESKHIRQDGTVFPVLVDVTAVKDEEGNVLYRAVNVQDITERKRAEETAVRLASFPERNPNPIVQVDLAGRVQYINPAARRLFPDLLMVGLGHPWLVGWESVADRFQTGGTDSIQREVMIGECCYEQELHYIEDDQCVRIYGLDITERKRAEEALARHDQEMAALYKTSLEINTQPDVSTLLHAIVRRAVGLLGTQMGGLYLMKPGGRRLELVASHNLPGDYTGVTLDLGEGLSGRIAQTGEPMMVEDYSHWDKRAGVYTDLGARRVLGAPLKVGDQVIGVINVTDDQKTGPFDEDQVRLLGLFADQAAIAVENARLVEALRRQNEYLAALQETTLDLISRLNLDNLLENIVKRAGQLLGTPHGYLDLAEPETGQLEPKIGVGALTQSLQFIVKPGEGVAGTVWQTGQPVVIDDYDAWPSRVQGFSRNTIRTAIGVPMLSGPQVIGVLGLAYDFATNQSFGQQSVELLSQFARLAAIAIENARLVEALRRSNAELQARNEELDAFAHTVAHDLKSPLSLVIGYAGMAAEYAATPGDELSRCLNLIVRSGRKMDSIIDNLLLLAETRSAEVSRQPLEMASIVTGVQERLADVILERQAEIILPGASAWPVALGYAPWVEEVWTNYLSNALKYGGQPLRVELGAATQPDGKVRFWVRDNGPGIPPEAQARLFTPFTRLGRARAKGHGLGLSIVRRIVEKLGGQAGVESQLGQGSVFSFTLPGAPG